jgi:hypothetical protein
MWTEYLATSYPDFLASEDFDIEQQKQRLQDRFDVAREATRTETLRNTEELEARRAEYEALCRQTVSCSLVLSQSIRAD